MEVMVIKGRILAIGFLILLGCSVFQGKQELPPLNIVTYGPPGVYQNWANQALDCVKGIVNGTAETLPFTLEHNEVNVNEFVWIAVLTERPDGGFPCDTPGGYCVGRFNAPDTVYISGQYIQTPWVIKHEVMHYLVKSDGEKNPVHGPPWGLCEWVNN